ncbi:phosphoglycerate dehydrogenase [Beijerinckia sp. L45]|uniref:phosphoglycerate dehydrogenase n=1 Tax=Beijerinckia sp. L45 TaxID=1641855 RepID=UPI00131BA618|nr:phosphoglycerate dehydrogenase [Beijerinckia sp. L45]
MAPRVLISDALSPAAVALFGDRGVDVDFRPELGKDRDALAAAIGDYDGLAIRSATKVTSKLLGLTTRLKVVGRAGIGVDNVDVAAATTRGVIVMNTPFGNSITTAEHTIALMLALARQIPAADASTRAGGWEKNRFLGVELTGKCLGVVGCGTIGSIVCDRAIGLRMRVIAFDPFLSPERAVALGIEKVELDALLARADIITLHTPLTAQTRDILSAQNLVKTKPGVRIINCARGGLINEQALLAGLDSGHVAGAALDVFTAEPPEGNPLTTHPNVVCTPHLGASTLEAQENVALQIAEQMSDFLLRGAISNAINVPSISAEEAPKLRPFIALAGNLGSFAGQLAESSIERIAITYQGELAALNTKALTAALIAGLLRPMLTEVNVVSAPGVARARGIVIDEILGGADADYDSLITLEVRGGCGTRVLAGTVFQGGRPRLVALDAIKVDAPFGPQMVYVANQDRPGFVGGFASLLGDAGINIATFALGRDSAGGNSVALAEVDGIVPDAVLKRVLALRHVTQVKVLRF